MSQLITLEIILGILVALPLYSYIFYPIIISLISSFYRNQKTFNDTNHPSVSIIISVYNEENVIKERIKNISQLEYDFEKIELLVGSDCSTDRTNDILLELTNSFPWLSVCFFKERRGKASVLNDLVKNAKNDLLVFTDANTIFHKTALVNLVSSFHHQNVGGVSGRLILKEYIKNKNKIVEEKNYWEYETFIKKHEGICGVLIGANGGIYSIRRNLFIQIPINKPVTDDLFVTLSVLKQHYRFLYNTEAVAYEEVAPRFIDEFHRKVRFGATNFHTIAYFKDILLSKNVLLSFALWSHKIIRWFTPIIIIIIFGLNIFLLEEGKYYQLFFVTQIIFIVASILGYLLHRVGIRISPLVLSFYFLMTNVAILIGLFKFLYGNQKSTWESTPRG